MSCPLCNREGVRFSDHHLVPVCRGGDSKGTVTICLDCHNAVHSFFTNKELESDYNSIEALLANEKFSKHIKWLSKQDPSKRFKSKRVNDKSWGRNG